jgi:hypothetical protein
MSKIKGSYRQPKMVPVVDMKIADGEDYKENYQRHHLPTFTTWDWTKYDPIRVCRRGNGVYWVVDGGGRVRKASEFGIQKLPAFIHDLSGCKNEAQLFMDIFEGRKNLHPTDRYCASLCAGQEWAINIKKVLDMYGLAIMKERVCKWPCLTIVEGLRKFSIDSLDFACLMVTSTPGWAGEDDALKDQIICGLGLAWQRHFKDMERFDVEGFRKKLSTISPTVVLAKIHNPEYQQMGRRDAAAALFLHLYKTRKSKRIK